MFELHCANEKIVESAAVHEALLTRLDKKRTVDLSVNRKLFAGVVLVIGGQAFRIREDLPGPLRIRRVHGGTILCRLDKDTEKPLADLADVTITENPAC